MHKKVCSLMAPEAVGFDSVLPSGGEREIAPDAERSQKNVASKLGLSSGEESRLKGLSQQIHRSVLAPYLPFKRYLAELRNPPKEKTGEVWLKRGVKSYARKWTGANEGLFPPRPTYRVLAWSWLAAFVGIAVLALLTYNAPWYAPTDAILHEKIHTHLSFLIGSFGASAVLVFGSIDSPLAQPRNLVGGHVLSAAVGIAFAEAFAAGGLAYPTHGNKYVWIQGALAVATAIVMMQITRTVHPPGGATALIAVSSPPALRLKGFFIVVPVLSGALILLLVALIVNNMQRQYPLYWWSPDVLDVPMEDPTHHTGSGEAFMRHSESFRGASLHPSRGGPSIRGGGDSTHHSRVSYIDLSAGGSAHGGRRPPGEAFAPVRHHIIQFPMHVLEAEGALAQTGGTILEPNVVLDHPRWGGEKLVLPGGGRDAIPPMKRVEGWVENDAKGALEERGGGTCIRNGRGMKSQGERGGRKQLRLPRVLCLCRLQPRAKSMARIWCWHQQLGTRQMMRPRNKARKFRLTRVANCVSIWRESYDFDILAIVSAYLFEGLGYHSPRVKRFRPRIKRFLDAPKDRVHYSAQS